MKRLLLFCVVGIISHVSNAQIMFNGNEFQFPAGITEWSEPMLVNVITDKMEKKGLAAVPVQFRIKAVKRKAMACHYEVEVINQSADSGVEFSVYNLYTDATGKYIYHNVKLKPGATDNTDIVYSELGCKVKEVEDCTKCGWSMLLAE